ncbi:hypothetical protein GCM10022221_06030 [Actinocorallia aurea]
MSVLTDPLMGWLGALAGDTWLGLLRGSPEERLIREAMGTAAEKVVSGIAPDAQDRLRSALSLVFTRPPEAVPEATASGGLKAAVAAQLDSLRAMADEHGALFFDTVPVDPDALARDLADAFAEAVERAVAASGPAELVHALRAERQEGLIGEIPDLVASRLAGSLDDLRELLRALVAPPGDAEDPSVIRLTYLHSLRRRYHRIDLEILTPLDGRGDHPPMTLDGIFVPQHVKADPPPPELLGLPRALLRRLLGDEELAACDVPEGLDPEWFAAARDSYRARELRGVLDAVAAAQRTVILGDPGSGKSTLARYLMVASAAAQTDPDAAPPLPGDLATRLPLLVELRAYADPRYRGRTFLDLIDEMERTQHLGLPKRVLEEFLSTDGRALVVFDGLDEIFDPAVRTDVTKEIEGFAARHPAVKVVVTSRVMGYRRALLDAAGFTTSMLQDFTADQIAAFTGAWFERSHPEDPVKAASLRARVITAVESSPAVAEIAGNPLLLTILAIIARRRELPRDRLAVYRHAVTVLVDQWDMDKFLPGLPGAMAVEAEDKLEMLHTAARRMQSGSDGPPGNHLPGSALVQIFTDHLTERFGSSRPEAVAASRELLKRLRERNFILASIGANLYGFVHRAFLEYLVADDLAHRLRAHLLGPDDVLAVYTEHAHDPEWAEPLLLLTAMLPERQAVAVILHLIALDPHWRVRAGLPRPVLLSLRAARHLRKQSSLAPHARLLTDTLIDLLRAAEYRTLPGVDPLVPEVQKFCMELEPGTGLGWLEADRFDAWYTAFSQDWRLDVGLAAETVRVRCTETTAEELRVWATSSWSPFARLAALKTLAVWHREDPAAEFVRDRAAADPHFLVREGLMEDVLRGRDSPGLLAWLCSRIAGQEHPDAQNFLMREAVRRWPGHPDLDALLRRIAVEGEMPRRLAALVALKMCSPDAETTRALLRHLALNDDSSLIDGIAFMLLAETWGGSPEGFAWFRDVLRHPSARVRLLAVDDFAKGWRHHPAVRPLVRDIASTDPSTEVRRSAAMACAEHWPGDPGTEGLLCRLLDETAEDPPYGLSGSARIRVLRVIEKERSDHSRVLSELADLVRSPDYTAVQMAVEALAQTPGPTSDRLLLFEEVLDAAEDSRIRLVILEAIADGWPAEDRARSRVFGLACTDAAPLVRSKAVSEAASRWPEQPETFDLLRDRAVADEDDIVRTAALEALASRWPQAPETRALLLDLADDEAARTVRGTAMRLLAVSAPRDPDVLDVLRAALARNPQERLGRPDTSLLRSLEY